MKSIEHEIKDSISKKKRGTLFFPSDFQKIGSSGAVRIALHRLHENGFIKRVATGIYVRPKISEYIGEVLPSAEEVIQAIAKRDKIKLIPTGVHALHVLGMSTQIPTKLVFLTDGSAREIKIGSVLVKLKKASPKILSAKGKISSLAIQALRAIGKDKVTAADRDKIQQLLSKEDPKYLEHDIALAPEWIKAIMQTNRIE